MLLFNPYKFNGKELDTETNLYYYGARYYEPVTSLFLSTDRFSRKCPIVSSYSYCSANPIKYIDVNGDSTRIHVETEGVGHTWVSVGEGDDMVVYTYGRYDDIDYDKLGKFCPTGDGVLVRLEGSDAEEYNNSKSSTGYISYVVTDVNDNDVKDYYDKLFNSSSELPSNEQKIYYNDARARVIDRYNILTNNCTTIVCDMLNELESNCLYSSRLLTNPYGQTIIIPYKERFVIPARLSNFLQKNE